MKKVLIIATLIFVIFVAILYINSNLLDKHAKGWHNEWTGKIKCEEFSICLHEVGHKADHEGGWISKTDEWKIAVSVYRGVMYKCPTCRDEMSEMIMFFPGIGSDRHNRIGIFTWNFLEGGWGGYRELYADILKMSGGNPENVPESLRGFYDWERIGELMSEYENMAK